MTSISLKVHGERVVTEQTAPVADVFRARNPRTGAWLEETFSTASADGIRVAVEAAAAAFPVIAAASGAQRALLLRTIADELEKVREELVGRAHEETGLPLPRLQGELTRTISQLRLFAGVVEEGSWVDARIDEALPDRNPLPRSDVRSMLRPIGPGAVFGASNFPLAFSVAGGDTASMLAAGNPVIVKAHPAHPGTSRIAAEAVTKAVMWCGMPPGVFAILFDAGINVGKALVQHQQVKSVAFTGSASGGRALMRLAAERPEPIPCFTEMGSTNPLFILPHAMRERGSALAQGLQGSFLLGSGQFCTKPGLVFIPEEGSEAFLTALQEGVNASGSQGMLTHDLAKGYANRVQTRLEGGGVSFLAGQPSAPEGSEATAASAVFSVTIGDFLAHPELEEEVFGPTTLLVHYSEFSELLNAVRALHGHLTATLHVDERDFADARELLPVLEERVGRVLFNGYPTGVEVCHAMVHGGPFPATSDARFTSVGTRAMLRFVRPVCYQDCPDRMLPAELRRENPLGIQRMVNGIVGRS